MHIKLQYLAIDLTMHQKATIIFFGVERNKLLCRIEASFFVSFNKIHDILL